MDILKTIIANKQSAVIKQRSIMPVAVLRESHLFDREILSLTQYLLNPGKTGIIAEFKRKSPSKGIINEEADVLKTTMEYTSYGASGLSILTDEFFFGGSSGDLVKARVNPLPILRKDFIIDEYQVIESRAIGADALLLIAACLQPRQVKGFAALAKDIGMEVLLEIHEESELEHICDDIDLVGINSRDLKSFAVDTDASLQLLGKTPPGRPVIAESGINSVESVVTLRKAGFSGFLIGEKFMKERDPGKAFGTFVSELKKTKDEY